MFKNQRDWLLLLSALLFASLSDAAVFSCDNHWTRVHTNSKTNLKQIYWDGNAFIAYANATTPILESQNAKTWHKKTSIDTELKKAAAEMSSSATLVNEQSRFLAQAVKAHGVWVSFIDSRIYTSKDRKIWHLQSAFSQEELETDEEHANAAKTIRAQMAYVKFDQHKILVSTDAKHWQPVKSIANPSVWGRLTVALLKSFKNNFVAVNFLGSTYISLDGLNWQVADNANAQPGSVALNSEHLLLTNGHGGIVISDQPGHWQTVQSVVLEREYSHRNEGNLYLGDVVWNNKRFVIAQPLDNQGSNGILHSQDGSVWEKDTLDLKFPLTTAFGTVSPENSAWNGSSLLSLGSSENAGIIYQTSCHVKVENSQ